MTDRMKITIAKTSDLLESLAIATHPEYGRLFCFVDTKTKTIRGHVYRFLTKGWEPVKENELKVRKLFETNLVDAEYTMDMDELSTYLTNGQNQEFI